MLTLILFSVLFFLSKWTLFLFRVSEEDAGRKEAAELCPTGEVQLLAAAAAALRSLCVAHSYRTLNLRLV